jgi:hypothetical protein
MKMQNFSCTLFPFSCLLCLSLSVACQTPAKNRKSSVKLDSSYTNKIDSRLLTAVRESKTGKIENTVPVTLPEDSTGTIRVELKAKVSDSLLKFLRLCGASNIKAFNQLDVMQCGLPLSAIEKVALRNEVDFIRPAPVMQLDIEPR